MKKKVKKIRNKRLERAEKTTKERGPHYSNHYLLRLVRHIEGLLVYKSAAHKAEVKKQIGFLKDFLIAELGEGALVEKNAERIQNELKCARQFKYALENFIRNEQ